MPLGDYSRSILGEKTILGKSEELASGITSGAKTLLGNILRQVSRPGYAVTTPLAEIAQHPEQDIRKSIGEGFIKGLTLKEPKGFGDTLSALESKLPEEAYLRMGILPEKRELAKKVLGFTGDVALDPLTWLGPGILKGATAVGGKIKKAAEPLAKSSVGKLVGGAFSKNYALKAEFPELAKQAENLEDLLKYQQVKSVEEARRIKELVPNKDERVLITSILEDPNLESATVSLSKAGQKVLGWLKKVRSQTEAGILEREMLPEESLIDYYVRHLREEKPSVINVIKKAISEATPGFLKKRKIEGSILDINEKMGKPFFENDIALIHGIHQTEVRKAFSAYDYLKNVSAKYGVSLHPTYKVFGSRKYLVTEGGKLPIAKTGLVPISREKEIANIVEQQSKITEKLYEKYDRLGRNRETWGTKPFREAEKNYLENAGLLSDLRKMADKSLPEGDVLYKLKGEIVGGKTEKQLLTRTVYSPPIEGFSTVDNPRFKELFEGKQFPKEIADHIAKMQKTFASDESLNAIVKGFDAIQNWWKGQVLISPAYHTRNMVGNFWNNWLADVSPKNYLEAGKLQMAELGGKKSLRGITYFLNGKQVRGDQLIEDAKKLGVIDSGWYAADIPESIKAQVGKKYGVGEVVTGKPVIDLNRKVGSAVENNAKLAHFIDKRAKGFSPEEAALSVKKTLFDYTDLAPFEKEILKRFIPFYTWTRKNIPLQLQYLLTKPGKFATLEKGVRNIELKDKEAQNMPAWAQEGFMVPLLKKEGKVSGLTLENYLPAMDINKLAKPETAFSILTPFIKTPIEMALNKSAYFKRPLEEIPGQTTPFGRPDLNIAGVPLGADVSSRYVAPILGQIRVVNELNKLAQNPSDWQEYAKFLSGGKLYQYDPELEKSLRLLDKAKEITDKVKYLSAVYKRAERSENPVIKLWAEREMRRMTGNEVAPQTGGKLGDYSRKLLEKNKVSE